MSEQQERALGATMTAGVIGYAPDIATITTALMRPFPQEAIKTRQGGGNTRLRYVEGHSIIHRLIDATGNHFDLRVLSLDQKGDLLTALVELTIPGLGSRQHIGVQKISERGGEDLAKGAITDAMKKAATLFGVGLELYGPDYAEADATQAAPPSMPPAAFADFLASLTRMDEDGVAGGELQTYYQDRAATLGAAERDQARAHWRAIVERRRAVKAARDQETAGTAETPDAEAQPDAENFGATEFWHWARTEGLASRQAVETALGAPIGDRSWTQVRAALDAKDAAEHGGVFANGKPAGFAG